MNFRPLSDQQVAALFSSLEEQEAYVFLDTSKPDEQNYRSLLFLDPVAQLCCHHDDDRLAFYRSMNDWLQKGFYLAGWIGYEFLQAKKPTVLPAGMSAVAELGVYRLPKVYDHRAGAGELGVMANVDPEARPYRLQGLLPNMECEEYCRAIRLILDYIAAGDTYQVNYTFKMHFGFTGSIARLYRDLRRSQPVPYGCCIRNGEHYVLSFSPELFFRSEGQRITARPMKGTIARGRTRGEDAFNSSTLRRDIKNQSENVMIVDLLRNDLSRLVDSSGGGTVRVDSLFDIEKYQTVFQMTSTIVAERSARHIVSPEEMLQALFPCGSVTGAPKIRTMEIIEELENERRGVYTGAIGYFGPQGQAVFNVPIRTLVIDGNRGEMGIGSGIVADSSPEAEWDECLLKARFLTHPLPEFELIETLLFDPQQGYLFLEEHLERLAESADYFNFYWDGERLHEKLLSYAETLEDDSCRRVRLLLTRTGETLLSSNPCARPEALVLPDEPDGSGNSMVSVDFAQESCDTSSPWVFHKTTRREVYDRVLKQARAAGNFDMIFCNQDNQLTEGCITNLFLYRDNCYFTPPVECGLLNGIMRRRLIAQPGSIPVREQVLSREDLAGADMIYLCNSVRGVLPARLRSP